MKVKGKKLELKTASVELMTADGPLVLLLTAVQPGYLERLEMLGVFDVPEPPRKLRKVGDLLVRDKSGNPQYDEDRGDPEWKRKQAAVINRKIGITLAQGLRNCSDVEFDVKPPDNDSLESWIAYGDSIHRELQSVFHDDEIYGLLGILGKLSTRLDVAGATNAFLDQ
jgi:hypothetical protein